MRFTDLMMAFPALLLAIVLAAIFRPSLWIVALVIAMVNWVQIARVIYTETRSLAERDFVEAERSLGAGTARILFRHILPHLRADRCSSRARSASPPRCCSRRRCRFLGVGVQPPTPSWGNIIFENQTYFSPRRGWCSFPARDHPARRSPSTSSATRLRDILDPTQQGRD